jgi:hypothetical protein
MVDALGILNLYWKFFFFNRTVMINEHFTLIIFHLESSILPD